MPDYSTASLLHPSEISCLFPWSVWCHGWDGQTVLPRVAVQTRYSTAGRFMSDLAQAPMKSPVGKELHTTHLAVAPHPSALEKVLYVTEGPGGTGDHRSSCHRYIPIQSTPSLGFWDGFFGGFGFAKPQVNDKELWENNNMFEAVPQAAPFPTLSSNTNCESGKENCGLHREEARNDCTHNPGLKDPEPMSSFW